MTVARNPQSPHFWWFAVPLLVGLFEAAQHAWVCDDIFISLRYIANLFQGDGLVFNAGERVEGYTHFLWVMILASLHRLGIDLVWLAKHLSLVAFALVLGTLWLRAGRRARNAAGGLPIAALGLAFHKDMQIYASGGLETMAFTLVLLWAVLVTAGRQQRWDLAAALYALATLLRPEGALYTSAALLFVLWTSRNLRTVGRFAILWALLVVPSEIFRLVYFGEWLPNTYYAKSGGTSNWHQGWIYTSLYFSVYAVQWLSLPAFFAVVIKALRNRPDSSQGSVRSQVALLASSHILLSLLYVTRLGGDFMFARFYIPITPLLFLLVEDAVLLTRRRSLEVIALLVVLGGVLYARLPHAQRLPGRERIEGIVNEYNFYPSDYIEVVRRQGEVLGRALQGTKAGVGLLSGQDAMAYFGNLHYALEPHGLTDHVLARKPITERGRPGHERTASLEDLLLRSVHFRMRYGFTVGLTIERQIRFEDLYGEIIFYDRALMEQMRGRPGIVFLDYPELLRKTIQDLEGSQGRLVDDYRQAHLFYFIHNDDAALLSEYRTALLQKGIPIEALNEVDRKATDFRRRMLQENLRPSLP